MTSPLPSPIQRVVFPTDDKAFDLYARFTGPPADPAQQVASAREVRLREGQGLLANTYFNAFFHDHWRELAGLEAVTLRLEVSGRGAASLHHSTVAGEPVRLRRAAFAGERVTVELPLDLRPGGAGELPPEPGIAWFRLAADGADVTLHAGAWCAAPPEPSAGGRPPAGLVLGYTTFKRERYLLRNLRRLASDPEVMAGVRRVVVADNGRSEVLPAAAAALGPKFAVLPQDNVGGSGGFARIMLEAAADPGCSHFLLMDDDAHIEPEAVFRTMALLARARRPVAVGGHMLELHRSWRLHEAGARITSRGTSLVPFGHGQSMADEGALHGLARCQAADYNGWWFFAAPTALLREAGLPLPFFLKYDDIEFGLRLGAAGAPTYPIPGVAVWHEPFYRKLVDVGHRYFEPRNMLAFYACCRPKWDRQPAKAIRRDVVGRLLALDYFSAWLIVRGAEDFLLGPAVLERDQGRLMRELAARRAEFDRTRRVDKRVRLPPPRRPASLRWLPGKLRAWAYLLRHRWLPPRPFERVEQLRDCFPDHEARWGNVGDRDFFAVDHYWELDYQVRTRDRALARAIHAGAARVARRLDGPEGAAKAAEWRAAHARFRTEAWWRRHLRLDPAPAAGAAAADEAAPVAAAAE